MKDTPLNPSRKARLMALFNAGAQGVRASSAIESACLAGLATLGWADRDPRDPRRFTINPRGVDALAKARTAAAKEEPEEA